MNNFPDDYGADFDAQFDNSEIDYDSNNYDDGLYNYEEQILEDNKKFVQDVVEQTPEWKQFQTSRQVEAFEDFENALQQSRRKNVAIRDLVENTNSLLKDKETTLNVMENLNRGFNLDDSLCYGKIGCSAKEWNFYKRLNPKGDPSDYAKFLQNRSR